MSIWRYANPAEFMRLSGAILPWAAGLAALLIVGGAVWGLFFTPADYQQGETVRIMYVHVPASMMAINIYFIMAVASVIGIVRRHHVSFLVAKAAAPIGAGLTLAAIVTGAIWGQPTWGTWWVWDPKLTSILIMLFFYLGYIGLWAAIDDPDKAADLSAVLCLTGVVFAFLSRYAVEIFGDQTLHQPASLSLDMETNVAPVFFWPLLATIAGYYAFFIALVLLRARTEIRLRRARALRMARAAQEAA
ncbi:MAG: transcriptional regulator [Rhodobacterales bacterium CG18_big_fil_WC_8_21_14_2_50_71_9]|nr:MAG: transcriptional regulator [Rhodobacterales bacterium CG18_big_fil_WC_8_21_14_2_50_71_9]